MKSAILIVVFSGGFAFITLSGEAWAEHRSCGYGYSIGGYAVPVAASFRAPIYRSYSARPYAYNYSPLNFGYRSFGHYDYHPGHFDYHRGHFDYHPSHFDYHPGVTFGFGVGQAHLDFGHFGHHGHHFGHHGHFGRHGHHGHH